MSEETVATDTRPHKPSMEREALRDIISLSLWAGQMLLQNGADSQRVEETVHRLGTGLGCDWLDVVVNIDSIVASTINNHEFRTRVRRAPARGVNMALIAEINRLSRAASAGELDRFALRAELRRIDAMPRGYSRAVVIGAVGLACAAFSRLFGGDWAVFLVTFAAASAAMYVRQELQHRHFNHLLVTIVTAFTAGVIASSAAFFQWSDQPGTAMAAAVLLLVPGVPLINCVEDLIQGHITTGLARGLVGGLISLAIALGLSLAIWLTGVSGL